MRKVRVVSLACDIPAGTYLCLPNIKIFQTIKKLWCAQELGLEIHSEEITRRPKQALSFLHAILLLDLIMFLPIIIKLSQSVWELWPGEGT